MQLNKIIFRERPGYRDIYTRSFTSNPDMTDVNAIDEATNGGQNLDTTVLSRVARNAIRTSSDVGERVEIANGWSERRLMFAMEVTTRDTRSGRTTVEISGHTDFIGAVDRGSRGVSLARDMRLYFNNVTEISHNLIDIPRQGRQWQTVVSNSSHVITPYVQPNFSRDRVTPGTMTMRPEDIYHQDAESTVQSSFDRRARKEGFADMRFSVASHGIVMSDRRNDVSTHFMSRSLRALNTANNESIENRSMELDESKALRDARGSLRERTFKGMPILAEIARDSNIMSQGFVTLGELMDMNEDFNWDDVEVSFLPPELRHDYSGSTSGWDGRDHTSVVASHIARALPTYMIYHQIGIFKTEVNNQGFGGEVTFLTNQARSLDHRTELTNSRLDAFEHRLSSELLEEALPWEGCPFIIEINAELGRDVYLYVSVAGENSREFVYPLISDSPSSPIIVEDAKSVLDMGRTMSGIVDMFGSSTETSLGRGRTTSF